MTKQEFIEILKREKKLKFQKKKVVKFKVEKGLVEKVKTV